VQAQRLPLFGHARMSTTIGSEATAPANFPSDYCGGVTLTSLRGFLITGQLAAGKTTVARRLVDKHGFHIPTTTTTRTLGPSDFGLRQVTTAEFVARVRNGDLRMPMSAGGGYYAWEADSMRLLRTGTRIVVSVRPYTAVVLAELLDGLYPVWLDVTSHERERRLSLRNEHRDINPTHATGRARFDKEDESYAELIAMHLSGVEDTADKLARIYEGG
jgi:guanylate kinase